MTLEDLTTIWSEAIRDAALNEAIGPSDLALFRMCVPLGAVGDNLLIAVPSEYARSALEGESAEIISKLIFEKSGQKFKLVMTVNKEVTDAAETENHEEKETQASANVTEHQPAIQVETDRQPSQPEEVAAAKPTGATAASPAAETKPSSTLVRNSETRLNSKYTFDTFVTGSSNRFARATAFAVAENPAKAYNPLFIYGESGLGKTHLLHSIGHYALQLYPHLKVLYTNSEEFTNDFINSIEGGQAEEFKRRYREVDILLIDDIQFLQGRERTIEEFFHTFNTLHNAEKQVVITSDVAPKNLNIEERMRSRFEWGLLTDIQPPDLETRMAILQKKAAADGVELDDDVLEYIASRFAYNIRELEGALVRVTAFASLNNQPMTKTLTQMVLKDIISDSQDTEITIALVKVQTANYFDISIEMLDSSNRSRNISEARQIAMYLCRELTNLPLTAIGSSFGGRDHTTVMHANKKIAEAMQTQSHIYKHVTELTNRIRQAARN